MARLWKLLPHTHSKVRPLSSETAFLHKYAESNVISAWTMPLAFVTVIVVSKLTPHRIPAGAARSMVRLHTPEAVDVDRGLPSR